MQANIVYHMVNMSIDIYILHAYETCRYRGRENSPSYKKKSGLNNESTPTISITLNYQTNEIITYYNDEKLYAFNQEHLGHLRFYPTFCIVPRDPLPGRRYPYQQVSDHKEPDQLKEEKEETSTFEIISCSNKEWCKCEEQI